MCWSFRKFFTNLKSSLKTFLFFMLCKSLLCITLLNAFFSFRLSNETILLLMSLHTICIFFIISCKVIFINLCLQVLIWIFNIKLQTFITFCKHLNMMNFRILLSVSSDRWRDSSVYDVNYKSFDSMFWIKVRRVKRSQFNAV